MLYDEKVVPTPALQPKKLSSGGASGEAPALFLDSDPSEKSRHSSVFTHFCRVPHRACLLEVSDTPWGDFPCDAMAALNGADSALLVLSAADPDIPSSSIQAYQRCRDAGIPVLVALSKMDRPYVKVDQVLQQIESELGMKPTPLQVLARDDEGRPFESVFPLFRVDEQGSLQRNPGAPQESWEALEEAVAVTDDALLMEYLENGSLEGFQVINGLRAAVRKGKILPFVYTSALENVGIHELMDAVVAVLPNPLEMRAEALGAACETDQSKCSLVPGVEAGFAARVLHTTLDSFGSTSVLRVVSNSQSSLEAFDSLPSEVVNLRTGERLKLPGSSNCFSLCGKERQTLDATHILPGDVIAIPRLPESVLTNDVLVVPGAVKDEKEEILLELESQILSPLSRSVEAVPLMATATVSVSEAHGKKGNSNTNRDDKLSSALAAMSREDLAIQVDCDAGSGKLLIRCMSQDHLQLVVGRLHDRYGINVELGRPPVAYRETLAKGVTNVEGRHKKQSGGSGQFGVCVINMEPLPEGFGIEFESQIKGGVISKPFISSVEKGVIEQLKAGGPMGYPVTDVRVVLVDGKMHSVDSKDIAFQSAGKAAVKAALSKAGTRLLQPMEKVTFSVGDKHLGEINGIVSRHDGYVTSTDPGENHRSVITAVLPSSAIDQVSAALRAATAGDGQYVTEFSHYHPINDEKQAQSIVQGSDLLP
jgi:elongation factor G